MKRILISNACIACGQCFSTTDFIREDASGKAVVSGSGVISDKDAVCVQSVVEGCPVHAISLEQSYNSEDTIEGNLSRIKKEVLSLSSYTLNRPTKDEMICDKSMLKVVAPVSGLTSRYSFKSESQAESEGMKAFEQIVYSHRSELAKSALINYKKIYLNQYAQYEKNDSCYYYRENKKIEQLLQTIGNAIYEATEGKCVLSSDLISFEFEPENLKIFAIAVRDFEDTYATTTALENVESAGWYRDWINTDEKELASRSRYNYDLNDVVKKISEHITDGCMDAVKDVGVRVTDDLLNWYQGVVTQKLQHKVKGIANAIDEYLKSRR